MIFIGDLHGNFNKLYSTIENIGDNFHTTNLIQVGDFGIGFDPKNDLKTLENLNEHLKSWNCMLYVIRGNHDDPKYWNINYDFSNIILVPDYTEKIIENKKVLFIGGGISIDRVSRKVNKSWWVDETIQYKKDINQCDILVTHVPLLRLFNNISRASKLVDTFAIKESMTLNSNLYEDLDKEQFKLEYIFKKANPTIWISGHMHEHHLINKQNNKYIILDIDEFMYI